MATIDSQVLFITISPRTPAKMVPEIDLLIKNFQGKVWNKETQCDFMEILREEDFYNGRGSNDPSFSARDRINRAPKSLGFVTLSPTIQITPAGEALIKARNKEEVFLRQMPHSISRQQRQQTFVSSLIWRCFVWLDTLAHLNLTNCKFLVCS